MIQLTTAFNPGDMDPGKSYTHVQIHELRWDMPKKQMMVRVVRGYLESSNFVIGKVPDAWVVFADGGPKNPQLTDYTDLIAGMPQSGESIYQAAGRELYTKLITDYPEYAGVPA